MISRQSILSYHSRCSLLCGFLAIFCLVGCDEQDAAAIAADKRIKSLVKVGSDIDAAIVMLLESGEFAMSSWVARERIPPLAGCSLARQRSAFSIAPR